MRAKREELRKAGLHDEANKPFLLVVDAASQHKLDSHGYGEQLRRLQEELKIIVEVKINDFLPMENGYTRLEVILKIYILGVINLLLKEENIEQITKVRENLNLKKNMIYIGELILSIWIIH